MTKNTLILLNMFEPVDYRTCHNCEKETYIDHKKLCQKCYKSGNKNIDKFIKHTQPYLVWVPYNNFLNIKYIAEGGFSKIFKANWNSNGQKRHIVLKALNNSKNADTKFLNELKLNYELKSKFVIKCYGATQDPKTKNYAFILDYAPNGDLHHFLCKNFKKVTWKKKIDLFRDTIIGIKLLHNKKIIHCDLHSGNILIITNDFEAVISDLGFSQRVT
ncbi:4551_t:CDS:2, partial [Diversispora eburnea]